VTAAIVGCGGVLAAYLVGCPWIHVDYDNFHGDIFSGAVMFEAVLVIITSDPYATIASLFYLAAWAGDLLILRAGNPKGQPKQVLVHAHGS
jgi:hypothetical protein